jgi:hypothetical protein
MQTRHGRPAQAGATVEAIGCAPSLHSTTGTEAGSPFWGPVTVSSSTSPISLPACGVRIGCRRARFGGGERSAAFAAEPKAGGVLGPAGNSPRRFSRGSPAYTNGHAKSPLFSPRGGVPSRARNVLA